MLPPPGSRPASADPAVQAILASLSPAQVEAVTHGTGPLLIVAGAGTGKTTVLTRRIAYLVASGLARPEEILALTFTDKAALEMQARVDVLVPYGYADVRISTFHAFGDWLLREHALELGLTPAFRVLSRAEQVVFLKARIFELPFQRFRPLGDPTRHLQALAALFGRAKDEAVSPEEFLVHAEALARAAAAGPPGDATGPEAALEAEARRETAARTLELARAYGAYRDLAARAGVIDFGDQILLALRLLRECPAVLAVLRRRFRHILVDEFQDTNHAQFELVRLLAGGDRNVTVVGDDDQAIFRFRGASMTNILGFDQAYPEARAVVLTENHRSGQLVLDAAYRLIRHNDPDRLESARQIDKRLRSTRGDGLAPRHLHFETVTAEADGVARLIEEQVRAGSHRPADFAILVRVNGDADPFLRSLNLRGLPWVFSGTQGLYDRPEVRLLLAFLRVVARTDEAASLFHLAASPFYRVPAPDLARLATHADRRHLALFDVLHRLDDLTELREALSGEGAEIVRRLVKDLERYMALSADRPTGEVLYQFLADSGWLARMTQTASLRDEAEVRNVAKLFRRIQDAGRALPVDRVRELVAHLDALIEAGDDPAVAEAEADVDAVRVLTVHKAKGLEFPVVFVVGLVQGRFPWPGRAEPLELPAGLVRDPGLPAAGAAGSAGALREERRLFYVAMTRAQRELILTSARDLGGRSARKVSQFVLEALDLPAGAARPAALSPLEELVREAARAEADLPPETVLAPDAPLTLSHRQVDDYQTCPLKYRYVHRLRVPLRRHHAVVYGETLHRVVEHYLRRRTDGLATSLDDLLQVFEQEWRNEGFLSPAHEAARKDAGRAALTRFWHEEEASGVVPVHVEREFGFALGPDHVRGRFDRVDVTADGVVIVDYKSSDVRDPGRASQRAAGSLQLKLYALAWREMTGAAPARVELRYLESGVVGQHVPEAGDLAEAAEAVAAAGRGIRAARFEATPSYRVCRACAYSQICPRSHRRGA